MDEPKPVLHGAHMQWLTKDGRYLTFKQVTEEKAAAEEVEQTNNVDVEQGDEDMADEDRIETQGNALDDDFLMDMPEIPMPDEDAKDVDVVEDEVDVAFKLAFVGIGQGGGRIAESFYKLGYRRVCCINTNTQDLTGINIPEANKLVMDIGDGGAGKDMAKGDSATKKYHEDVYDIMRKSFGRDFDRIMVCVGSGGGTGSGGCQHVIDIAHEIATSLKAEGDGTPPAVGVIVSLPKVTEGGKVNANAHAVLDGLFRRVGTDKGKLAGRDISPLVIIDNDKIDQIYPNLPVAKFWDVANKNISSLFHLFNSIACKDSDFTTFDRADLKDVLECGVLTFGACPLRKWESATDISHAIRDNLRRNVLVGGFDLSHAKAAACVFIASGDVLDVVPQSYLEHGFEMLTRIMHSGSVVHRSIYKATKPGLMVYTIMAELSRPSERIEEIARIGGIKLGK